MVRSIINASFDRQADAYAAAEAIAHASQRRRQGLVLKAGILLGKDVSGEVSVLEDKERPCFGFAAGALAGAGLGLAAGPPGAAAGAAVSAVAGLTLDARGVEADEAFVAGVIQAMAPGTATIVLETDEVGAREVGEIVARRRGRLQRRDLIGGPVGVAVAAAPTGALRRAVEGRRAARRTEH